MAIIYALAEAAKVNKDALAIDLGRRIRSTEGVQKALQVSNQLGRVALARALHAHLSYLTALADNPPLHSEDYANGAERQRENVRGYDNIPTQLSNSLLLQDSMAQERVETGQSDGSKKDARALYSRANVVDASPPPQSSGIVQTIAPAKPIVPPNPFHKSSPASPHKRQRSLHDTMRELNAASPSPKRTSLSVRSNINPI